MKRLLLVYVCFFSGIGIQANFGVSLGSYTEISRANTALSVAQGQFEQEISIVQIQRNAGVFHRVIVGPFMDRSSADNFTDVARNPGYSGVWVSPYDIDLKEINRPSMADTVTEELFDVERELQKYESSSQKQSVYNDGPRLTEVPLSPRREIPPPTEVDDERVRAPTGFGLNKLRRRMR